MRAVVMTAGVFVQDELDLFGPPETPALLPLCLYRSAARGVAARAAEFEAWREQHGSFGSLMRAHAWTSRAGAGPDELTDRCQAAVLAVDLRRHSFDEDLGLECACTESDVYLYRGACRRAGCQWEGPPRDGLDAENPAAEDALDHAWPGWRDLPVLDRSPDDKKAAARWLERVAAAHPAGWLDGGGPIRTWRTGLGNRHVPGRAPGGGYDVGVPRPDDSKTERSRGRT